MIVCAVAMCHLSFRRGERVGGAAGLTQHVLVEVSRIGLSRAMVGEVKVRYEPNVATLFTPSLCKGVIFTHPDSIDNSVIEKVDQRAGRLTIEELGVSAYECVDPFASDLEEARWDAVSLEAAVRADNGSAVESGEECAHVFLWLGFEPIRARDDWSLRFEQSEEVLRFPGQVVVKEDNGCGLGVKSLAEHEGTGSADVGTADLIDGTLLPSSLGDKGDRSGQSVEENRVRSSDCRNAKNHLPPRLVRNGTGREGRRSVKTADVAHWEVTQLPRHQDRSRSSGFPGLLPVG